MKVVEEQSSLSVWVTIVSLLALGAVLYVGYQNRERFLPGKKAAAVVGARMSEATEQKYYQARDHIVAGRYDEASALLTSIDTDKVPQPARNWITMQNGLSRMLAGKLPEARAEFAKIEQRGRFTTDPRQEKLANFFLRTARLAASEEPVKSDVEREFEADTVETFAFLVFGMKDWLLGQFEDAAFLFRQFKSSEPPGTEIWLRRYRPIAEAYSESFAAFQLATDAAKDVDSHERKEGALKVIADAKGKIKNQPGLIARLTEIEKELKTQVDAVNAEMKKSSDAAMAEDQKIVDDVKARVLGFNEKFNFGDAHQIVFTATVNGDKAKTELDAWFKRTQWLARFKSVLISDISANGYPKPLAKKDGTNITGVTSADDTELSTAAKVKVQWPELTSDALVDLAKENLSKAKDDEAVERKWLLGNFLYQLGRRPDALALLQEAAAAKPDYKQGLPLFPEGGVK